MPYVITTLDTARYGEPMEDQSVADVDGATRTAVATLTEAEYTVELLIEEHGGSIDEWPDVPADGGTVGPLPDGTVIEVRPMLRDDVTMTAGENRYIAGMTADEMVTAFNAA